MLGITDQEQDKTRNYFGFPNSCRKTYVDQGPERPDRPL